MNTEHKMFVLRKIEEQKDILFAKFAPNITHTIKQDAWKEIHRACLPMNLFPGKDYTYIRDTFFQNLKRTTTVST